jgi:hypothetical protein
MRQCTRGEEILTIKDTLDIHVEDVVPAFLFGKVAVRPTPSDTGVIDEDVKFGLALLELRDEAITACFRLLYVSSVLQTEEESKRTPTFATM